MNDGGPAFPWQFHHPANGPEIHTGMSLRDWFAGMAMQGMLANSEEWQFDDLSQCAYMHADSMLAEREKGGAK